MKEIGKQPSHLYISGAPLPSDDNKFLCVVGARKYSDYGKEACDALIGGLRNYPVVIVSGLALGIDSLAHRAALENGLRTIAIPGSGLDRNVLYPPAHYNLAKHIIETGNTLLSPFEPDIFGSHWTFPVRNQLMAAMSHATLVIEGRERSGTLLTAAYTLELSRPVLIVPGSIFSDLSYGPHTLYRNGAIPVTNSKEILEALEFDTNTIESEKTSKLLDRAFKELPKDQQAILRELLYKPASSSALIEKFGLSPTQFNIIATQLELHGLVVESHGIYKINVYKN